MTHAEAAARAEQLNRDAGGGQRWFASQLGSDEWHVVAARLPAKGPLHETVEARPRPQNPPDPRPSLTRNIPPYGA
jgi:hypothetical protein